MILLDTIAYNTFLDILKGNPVRDPKLKKDEFKDFVLNYSGHKFIHSATLFEIYIKNLKSNSGSDFSMFVQDFNELKKHNSQLPTT